MVRSATFDADSSSGKTSKNGFVAYCDFNRSVNHNAAFFKGFRLRNSAGESVKDEAVFAIILGKTLLYNGDNKSIRNKFAGVHVSFCFKTKLGFILHSFAKNVACADGRNCKLFFKNLRLGAFSGARSSKKNKIHG